MPVEPTARPLGPETPVRLSRRSVLLGAAGLAALAACGSGNEKKKATSTTSPTSSLSLVAFFDGTTSLIAGRPQRAAFGIGDKDGTLVKDAPKTLAFQLFDGQQRAIGKPVRVERHDAGLPRAYFPLGFTVRTPGLYGARTTVAGESLDAAFQVAAGAAVKLPKVGSRLPALATSTTKDPLGVDPICTNVPACPLHDVNLRDALAQRKRIALLVATPAYCQTEICGPVLDVLVGQHAAYRDRVTFIHAEVYRSGDDVAQHGSSAETSPTVQGLHLPFEPCLFLVDPKGLVQIRLDVIFDEQELARALRTFAG